VDHVRHRPVVVQYLQRLARRNARESESERASEGCVSLTPCTRLRTRQDNRSVPETAS
jgi:hypothetical protein